jgi:hypothetical protein
MRALSLEKVFELLGTRNIPGNSSELGVLSQRLAELRELNGEPWILENRATLLDQWRRVAKGNTND